MQGRVQVQVIIVCGRDRIIWHIRLGGRSDRDTFEPSLIGRIVLNYLLSLFQIASFCFSI